jgi:predicted DNA-binding transcriptional regulator AlpA
MGGNTHFVQPQVGAPMTSTQSHDNHKKDLTSVNLIRATELAKHLAISKSTLYRWVNDPKRGMPPKITLSPQVVAWRISDIEQFILKKEARHEG